jgi:hypothetical protein
VMVMKRGGHARLFALDYHHDVNCLGMLSTSQISSCMLSSFRSSMHCHGPLSALIMESKLLSVLTGTISLRVAVGGDGQSRCSRTVLSLAHRLLRLWVRL